MKTKKKKKKGFTLIELLAVIVVLAIIALIATPIVMNLIKNAKKGALERSSDNYLGAVETMLATKRLDQTPVQDGTYDIIDDDGSLCLSGTTCTEETKLKVEMNGNAPTSGSVTIQNWSTTDAVLKYPDGTIVMDDNKELVYVASPVSFADDSWETIATNVKIGNLSTYKIDDRKLVEIEGIGTFEVRIANLSTPAECNGEGFSQTACGFVVEFVNIISESKMNGSDTNRGGWPSSGLRSYVKGTLYNSLPPELRDVIIDTFSVSGYSSAYGSSNHKTTDRLYLLSTTEIFGRTSSSQVLYDTAKSTTRQLDYYESLEVTDENYSQAKKLYNGVATDWWMRNAYYYSNQNFYYIGDSGHYGFGYADFANGVSVAFRIGK